MSRNIEPDSWSVIATELVLKQFFFFSREEFLEHIISRVNALSGFLMKILGPLLVLTSLALISLIIYAHFVVVLPIYTSTTFSLLFHWTLSIYLTICIYAHYLRAVFLDPGIPNHVELSAEEIEELKCIPSEGGVGRSRWCSKCEQPKAPRTHHCSYCNRCVKCFDHHCKVLKRLEHL